MNIGGIDEQHTSRRRHERPARLLCRATGAAGGLLRQGARREESSSAWPRHHDYVASLSAVGRQVSSVGRWRRHIRRSPLRRHNGRAPKQMLALPHFDFRRAIIVARQGRHALVAAFRPGGRPGSYYYAISPYTLIGRAIFHGRPPRGARGESPRSAGMSIVHHAAHFSARALPTLVARLVCSASTLWPSVTGRCAPAPRHECRLDADFLYAKTDDARHYSTQTLASATIFARHRPAASSACLSRTFWRGLRR